MGEPMITQGESQVLQTLGLVMGELKGLRGQLADGTAATNRRIDDLKDSIDKRLDVQETRIETLETGQKLLLTKTASYGGLAGGLVSGIIELIKWKSGG
jgi:hypothetical protein